MRLALDSNRYSDFARGDAHCVEILQSAEKIFIPIFVLGELRAGFAFGTQKDKNERVLTQFLNTDGVAILSPDENTTYFYANIYLSLRKRGTPIPTNDLWIAALTIQHHLVLFDRDSHFDSISQLARVK